MKMSHVNIIKFLKSKQKNINIDGMIGDLSWITPTMLIIILSIITYMCYIYKFYKFYKINRFYSDGNILYYIRLVLVLVKEMYTTMQTVKAIFAALN